jgi:hypothetical protein
MRINQFIDLPIQLLAEDGEKIYLYNEVHVIDKLPVPIFLEMNFLKLNQMDIVMKSSSGAPVIRVQNHYVPLRTKAKKSSAPNLKPVQPVLDHKCRVKVSADIIIESEFGQNIPVNLCYSKPVRKRLPAELEQICYVLKPSRYHQDMFTAIMGSLPNALIAGNTSHLPFTNFGKTPIRIRKEELLGVARTHQTDNDTKPGSVSRPAFCLNMESIFSGMPPPLDEDSDGASLPFDIQPAEEDVSLKDTNVSAA